MGILFLAGIYGVGKSTIGKSLSQRKGIPFFSAGDLISQVNGEAYGANKVVTDKMGNQDILAMQIEHQLEQHDRLLLAGHFCIINGQGEVDRLPEDIFKRLHIEKIILLEAPVDRIMDHLLARDSKQYSTELVDSLMQTERKMANDVSKKLNCPMVTYRMTYTPADILTLEQVL